MHNHNVKSVLRIPLCEASRSCCISGLAVNIWVDPMERILVPMQNLSFGRQLILTTDASHNDKHRTYVYFLYVTSRKLSKQSKICSTTSLWGYAVRSCWRQTKSRTHIWVRDLANSTHGTLSNSQTKYTSSKVHHPCTVDLASTLEPPRKSSRTGSTCPLDAARMRDVFPFCVHTAHTAITQSQSLLHRQSIQRVLAVSHRCCIDTPHTQKT